MNETERESDLRQALLLSGASILWSGIVGSVAVFAALASGSLSLLGFGADAVIDSIASVVLVWRFRVETRQPERAERVEHAAERIVGIALLALAAYLFVGAIGSLTAGAHPAATSVAIALLVASIAVLPPLAFGKARVAARLASGALRADSILTGVAAVLALISLGSFAASDAFGLWWADAAAALLVSVIVIREGWGSLRLAAPTATGPAPPDGSG